LSIQNESKDISNSNNDYLKSYIYPNPTNGQFNIFLKNNDINRIIIWDSQGKVILERNVVNSNNVNIDLSDRPKGLYLINIYSNTDVDKLKIIVE